MNEDKQITKQEDMLRFSPETIALIKKTVATDATNDELAMFLHQASRAKLDPLARQIYFVKRGGKVNIQTSIDGFRLVAERSKIYAGQDEPEFEEIANSRFPKSCKVRVYKFSPTGQRYQAAVGVAYWDEYVPPQGQNFMWNKMPHTMLSKVAEALALRKAFPQDLSGLYTNEEMEQANTGVKYEQGQLVENLPDGKTENASKTPVETPQNYSSTSTSSESSVVMASQKQKDLIKQLQAQGRVTTTVDIENITLDMAREVINAALKVPPKK